MIFSSPYPSIDVPETPLTQFVLGRALEWKDKPALIDGPTGRTLTYGQLAGAMRMLAAGLAQRGFQKGDVFAIWLPNLPEYAPAFLAVAMLGGINTTVNSLYTVDEAAYQLNETGAKFLLTIPQFMDKALAAAQQSGVEEVFVLGEAPGATPFAALMQNDGRVPEVQINPRTDVVALPFSSGTSGRPKGVMLTHANIIAQLLQVEACQTLDDTIIGVLPFFHIYGMTLIMLITLWAGGTLVSVPRFDLEQFLQVIEKYKIKRVPIVPPIILALAKHPVVDKYDLSSVRIITSGAAPLGDNVERACAERLGCLVMQGYGMTEVSGASHITPDDPTRFRPGAVGLTLSNMETKIVDLATGQDQGPNERGEVWMRGPNVMVGYWNRPEETARTLDAEGWLRTGDVGYMDDDGYLYIVDRVKELIKYHAWQVAPAELEALLLSNPAIADAAVIGVPDEEAGEVPKAFVVLRTPLSEDDIMAFVAERVAPFKKIRRVEVVDAIPKSASGKILRRLLIEKERAALA